MARITRSINTLSWDHFLKRLWWFKQKDEDDSQFLKRAGITKHNKSKWLNSVQPAPSIDMIEKLANNLKLSAEEKQWLTFGSAPFVSTPPSLSPWRAPVFDRVVSDDGNTSEYPHKKNAPPDADTSPYYFIPKAEPRLAAGAGTFVSGERSEDYYAFRLDWLNHVASNKGDLWLFDVVGDSMSTTLEQGDIVLIDCGRQEPLHGKIYAIEEDNAVSIKRLLRERDGSFTIVSDNKALNEINKPLYPPKALGPRVRIIGRMIWSARTWL